MRIFVLYLEIRGKQSKRMTYRNLLFFIFSLISISFYAIPNNMFSEVNSNNQTVLLKDSISSAQNEGDTLKVAEINKEPQFPGGEEAMNAFIKAKLRYPKKAMKVRAEGRVILRLTITETGEINKITILRGIYPYCDEEAVFVARSMPKWIPGTKNGKAVPMQVIVPIPFEVPKEK